MDSKEVQILGKAYRESESESGEFNWLAAVAEFSGMRKH